MAAKPVKGFQVDSGEPESSEIEEFEIWRGTNKRREISNFRKAIPTKTCLSAYGYSQDDSKKFEQVIAMKTNLASHRRG